MGLACVGREKMHAACDGACDAARDVHILGVMITVKEFIRLLGGPTVVATRRNVTASAVTNWVARDDIPGEHRVAMWRMAFENGLDWQPPGADGLALVTRDPRAPAEAA